MREKKKLQCNTIKERVITLMSISSLPGWMRRSNISCWNCCEKRCRLAPPSDARRPRLPPNPAIHKHDRKGMYVKGMLLYSTVSSPLDRSKSFTLFLPWQTCSFRHQLGFSWKHSNHVAITCVTVDYSLIFPQVSSIARYSFIQLSELGCRGENENAQTS